jgi:hypothetical protein
MIATTNECIDNNISNICEATFSNDNLFCSVDILHKENDGYSIYEVKSSTNTNSIYFADIAFQKYVLEKCGIAVSGTYLVCINNNYVRNDKLDLQQLFNIIDVSKEVSAELQNVPAIIEKANETYSISNDPNIDLGSYSRNPYNCSY